MITTAQQLTSREREWLARMAGNSDYTLMPLKETYEAVPDLRATEAIRKKYGNVGNSWCKLIMAYTTLKYLRDTICLLHAPLNCNACVRNYKNQLFDRRGACFMNTPTTGMDRSQVIFGGEEALYNAILAVERDFHPEAIVIMTGCAPRIVEDDIPRVIERAQPQIKARLAFVSTAGFEGIYYGDAIEQQVRCYVQLMDPPQRKLADAVNILGNEKEIYWKHARTDDLERKYIGDGDELGRMIEGIGLKVHRVIQGGGGANYIRTAPEARVNTINCGSHGFPLAQEMQKVFGTPYIYEELSLGLTACRDWVMGLAKFMGREEAAEKFIKREEKALRPLWEQAREAVAGKVVIGQFAPNRGLSWLRFFKELGAEVLLAGTAPIIKAKHYDAEYYLHKGFNPLVIGAPGDAEDIMGGAGGRLRPTAVMEKLGIAPEDVIHAYTDFPAYQRAGGFDASNVATIHHSVHSHRRPGFPHRAVGYKGTEGFCHVVIEAVQAAQRKGFAPTFQGRLYGKAFESF